MGPHFTCGAAPWGRLAEKGKRPGGLRSRAAVFEESLSLKLEVEQDPQHEGEERERLDEHQTQKHRCADVSRSSRVARDPFASRRSDAALAERSAKRRDGQAEADGQSKRCGINRGLLRSGTLCEHRRPDREDGDESNNQDCSFFHNFLLMRLLSGGGSRTPCSRAHTGQRLQALYSVSALPPWPCRYTPTAES